MNTKSTKAPTIDISGWFSEPAPATEVRRLPQAPRRRGSRTWSAEEHYARLEADRVAFESERLATLAAEY